MSRKPTITSPRKVRRSKWPITRIPTTPACGNSSPRNPTSRRSNRSGSQRSINDRNRRQRNDADHPFAREIKSMTRKGLAVAVALAAAVVADTAYAQFYKGKTVTMIINYPAGGPTDIEGRIVAQHLPAHIAGKPTIVIKNVGGAGGVIGTNQLAEAAPNGENMGFFTIDVVAQLLGNPALRVNYADFEMIAGVEEPLVAYARKDTPPGLAVATDIMQAHEFKALSLNAQNSNTINQALSLDLLGLKYRAIPAYAASRRSKRQFCRTRDKWRTPRCRAGPARSSRRWGS